MSAIEFKSENIDHILSVVLSDINNLQKRGIDRSRILISIPTAIKNSIEIYKDKMDSKIEIQEKLFGYEVVVGYNNQICVFDKMAEVNDEFNEPIQLKVN